MLPRLAKIYDVGAALYFLALLMLPGLLFVGGMRARAFEERPLYEFPEFSAGQLLNPAFYERLNNALTDRNPLREAAVIANARFSQKVFGDISGRQVVKGLDGWIFISQSLTTPCVDSEALERQVGAVERLSRAASAAGAPMLFVVAPNKASVYPEKMSPAARVLGECAARNRETLRSILSQSSLNYSDQWDAMARLRLEHPDMPVYVPDETHWTEYGSAEFVRTIVERFANEMEIAPTMLAGAEVRKPDLSRMAGIYAERELPVVKFARPGMHHRNNQELAHQGPGRPFVHVTSSSTEAPLSPRRILFIHDSFMYVAWDQVSQYFSDVLYVHWTALTPDRLSALVREADAIVVETVEREAFARLAEFFSDETLAVAVEAAADAPQTETEIVWPRASEQP